MTSPREVMPIYVEGVPKLPRLSVAAGAEVSQSINRVTKLLDGCDALGITVTEAYREQLESARGLRLRKPGTRYEVSRSLSAELAAGEQVDAGDVLATHAQSTDAEARRVHARAAERRYVELLNAIRDAAPTILGDLHRVLAETLDEQADGQRNRLLSQDLQSRYELTHATAATLRWATGQITAPAIWWRFRKPELVWAWKLEQADAMTPGVQKRNRVTVRGRPLLHPSVLDPMGRSRVIAIEISGIADPNVLDAALHPEWMPDLVEAHDLATHAIQLKRAQLEEPAAALAL